MVFGMGEKRKKRIDPGVLARTYQSSANISLVVSAVIAAIEVVMLMVSVLDKPLYEEHLWVYRIYYVVLLTMALVYIGLTLYVKKDFSKRYRILNFANPICGAFLLLWSFGITTTDAVVRGVVDPTAYMTFSITLPLCYYMLPMVYMVIAVAGDLMMVSLTIRMSDTVATLPNLVIFFAFQLVLGVSLLYIKKGLTEQVLRTEKQKEEIEDLSRAQSRFFSSIGHEIRTPINAIIGLDEMIIRRNISDEVNEDAENILSASVLLLHLINDLLDMSKIRSGVLKLADIPYLTVDMFAEIWGMFSVRTKQKGLDLFVDLSPEIPTRLSGDEIRIKQILVNLLNNAVKYTRKGSVSLKVFCETDKDKEARIRFEVSDTGMGIKKENLQYLFMPYQREDENESKYVEGTGLGLTIVKQLVDMMAGTVDVESVQGEGSTFTVVIPQRIVDATPIGEIDVSREKNHLTIYQSRLYAPDAKILIVDDTPANLLVSKRLLEETRIQVETVGSGAEALKATKEKYYHVIMLDHFMPEMDGIECLHAIQKQDEGKCRNSKFIMLTANASPESESQYKKEGFDGFLAKPGTAKTMENEVRKLLPRELLKERPAEDKRKAVRRRDESDYENDEEVKDDLADALIRIFVSSVDETVEKLDRFQKEGDVKNYTVQVHSLKSTARLVKEETLSDMAEELEMAGKRGDMDWIREHHQDLIDQYRESEKRLTSKASPKKHMTETLLRDAYLTMMEAAYGEDLPGVRDVLESLKEYELTERDTEALQKMRDALEVKDYGTIVETSRSML